MKYFHFTVFVLLTGFLPGLNAQSPPPATPSHYSHKVTVEEILQTKNYTYLHVKENVNKTDSLYWLALPSFEPAVGDIYFFENGLRMGAFESKELGRKFDDIIFLGGLSTSPEVSEKNIVPKMTAPPEDSMQTNSDPQIIHTVVVQEVLQAGGYTYLRVREGDKEDWLAVVKTSAVVGQTFTYDDAALMTDFKSKELNRTFKEVLFVASLKKPGEESGISNQSPSNPHGQAAGGETEGAVGAAITITPAKGTVSIATLMENRNKYSGKKIKMNGKVMKYSEGIMGKNWIHIQDGTSFDGKSDFTITSAGTATVGEVIILEGVITLNKDYGSGYYFDVIMEDARIVTK